MFHSQIIKNHSQLQFHIAYNNIPQAYALVTIYKALSCAQIDKIRCISTNPRAHPFYPLYVQMLEELGKRDIQRLKGELPEQSEIFLSVLGVRNDSDIKIYIRKSKVYTDVSVNKALLMLHSSAIYLKDISTSYHDVQ